ncbi:MAG: DNA gyrase subunit A [archaeon]|nr:DNA gyrase subunit A [archaeon]
MQKSYIDYAMSVIVQRALPSVEDGLKPVHRRILYAMHKLGLEPGKPTVKSARIVGDTMGKYHPHGNLAVYDALVRMAQDFSLRYPLVHGQGNFGCFTADTKVKLADGRDLSFIELIEEHKQGKRNFTFTVDIENSDNKVANSSEFSKGQFPKTGDTINRIVHNGIIKIAEIKNPRKTRENAEIIKVILDNGGKIRCTPNHKFMLKDGSYKEAKDLKSGDSLMSLYEEEIDIKPRANHKVVGIEFLNEFADVYDLTIDKTHNFALASGIFVHNSLDGDSPAADRYTEAKLSKIAGELLEDLDKDTVKMRPNFDNSLEEPETLPAKLPNLLLNGATGIAVGMATNIPPHNLTEICEAIMECINKPDVTSEELSEIVKGPDFPTGGTITEEGLKELYKTGKGRVIIRGRTSIEEEKGRPYILITEIPYMVNKADLVKDIARLATEKKLSDVSDLRDESSKGKVRIVIELRKGVDPKFTLNKLYKMTNVQTSFDVNMLALVGNQPRVLGLKDILEEYIKYRRKIVRNRSKFELKMAEDRLEIVLGLVIALKDIDKIVELIKKSDNASAAHESLMKKFELTTRQAKAVLEIRLQQLTHMEVGKLKDEEKKLKDIIAELKTLLGDEKEILKVIKKEISEIKSKYGDDRKTRVIKRIAEIAEKDLIEKKDVVVMLTEAGYLKRVDLKVYREQKRGGAGVSGTELKEEDFVKTMVTCSTHDYLLFFTSLGRVYWLKSNDVPASERQSKGKAIVNVLDLRLEEKIANVMALKDFELGYVIFATKLGIVKKIPLKDLAKPRNAGVRVINLPVDNSDVVINVRVVYDKQEVILVTKDGKAIRFNSDEVRAMGRASYGVKGIELNKTDEIVSIESIPLKGKVTILTVTKLGYGKRSDLEDYRKTARAGKGVINFGVSSKTGDVISSISVTDKDSVIATTVKGMVLRTSMKDIRVMGRATQGVHVVRLKDGDKVASIVKVPVAEEGEVPAVVSPANVQAKLS